LVIDHEIIGMARRLIQGIDCSEDPLATAIIQQVGHKGNFLAIRHTRQWFQKELFMPSAVIDRDTRQAWEGKGARDTTQRAHERVQELIATYEPKELPPEVIQELEAITLRAAKAAGLDKLPSLK
jgi:trimethylamine--corrinoid protein Co-methyltransferase